MRNFTVIPNQLLDQSDLTIQERYLFCVLLRHCGKKDTCFPGQKRLANILGLSDRHIRTLVKNIKEKTDILTCKRSGWNRANTYTLSKELILVRKQGSYHLGSQFPLHQGTENPPKSTYLTGKGKRSLKGMEKMRETIERMRLGGKIT